MHEACETGPGYRCAVPALGCLQAPKSIGCANDRVTGMARQPGKQGVKRAASCACKKE